MVQFKIELTQLAEVVERQGGPTQSIGGITFDDRLICWAELFLNRHIGPRGLDIPLIVYSRRYTLNELGKRFFPGPREMTGPI